MIAQGIGAAIEFPSIVWLHFERVWQETCFIRPSETAIGREHSSFWRILIIFFFSIFELLRFVSHLGTGFALDFRRAASLCYLGWCIFRLLTLLKFEPSCLCFDDTILRVCFLGTVGLIHSLHTQRLVSFVLGMWGDGVYRHQLPSSDRHFFIYFTFTSLHSIYLSSVCNTTWNW